MPTYEAVEELFHSLADEYADREPTSDEPPCLRVLVPTPAPDRRLRDPKHSPNTAFGVSPF